MVNYYNFLIAYKGKFISENGHTSFIISNNAKTITLKGWNDRSAKLDKPIYMKGDNAIYTCQVKFNGVDCEDDEWRMGHCERLWVLYLTNVIILVNVYGMD